MTKIIEMKNIVKVYPDGTVALRGVDFEVDKGEIIGLLGENGAGKTTLMKILSGYLRPTKGEVFIYGKRVRFKNPSDALALGIGMVHQHFTLIPKFTVLENIVLGNEPRRKFFNIDWKKAVKKIREIAGNLGFTIDPYVKVESLSVGVQQRIEILKMLYRNIKILILDEPTSFLTPLEVNHLFRILKGLKEKGITIIFITHKIKEALAITDRIVVLRKGLVEGIVETKKATPKMLAKMMVKVEAKPLIRTPYNPGEPSLIVRDLWVKGDEGVIAVKGVSFKVLKGEIYGIVGVEGNGQKELIEAIIGLRPYEKGEVKIVGTKTMLAYIPADRVNEGLILSMPIFDNSILGIHKMFSKSLKIIDYGEVYKHTNSLVKKYDIITLNIFLPAKTLSGGNQQKLVLARELSKNPDLIIAAHPTRGLDVASTNYVRRLLLDLRNKGKAILIVTADIDEALEICDRIGVIYEGKIVGEDFASNMTEEKLGLLMGGIKDVNKGAY